MSEGLDNIDKIFKDAFEGFEANVDPSVWTNVQNAIGGASGASDVSPKVDPSAVASGSMKAIIAKVAIGVAVVGTVATTAYYVVNSDTTKDETVAENVMPEVAESDAIVETNQEYTESDEVNSVAELDNKAVETKESNRVDTPSETASPSVNNSPTEDAEKSTPSAIEQLANQLSQQSSATNESASSTSNSSETEASTNSSQQEKTSQNQPEKEEKTNYLPPKEENPAAEPAQVDIIPNVITPNGDGDNDFIQITGESLEKVEVVIMDKTGKPVYRIKSVEDAWNGKDLNGYDLIPGVYYMAGVVVDDKGRVKHIKRTVNLFK